MNVKTARSGLVDRLAALEARIEALEHSHGEGVRSPRSPEREPEAALQFLDALRRRKGKRYQRGATAGALGYSGFLRVDDRRYAWAKELPVPELLDADPADLSHWIAAIASPQRVTLLRELFGRDRTIGEIGAAMGDPSTGQLYHHLKELQAARIVVQVRRGVYRIAPALLIPLLVILAAAVEGVQARGTSDLEPFAAP